MDVENNNDLYPVASERKSVSPKKRKADTEPESPRKRLRCARRPAQLAVPAKGNKTRASPQRETPSKRQKAGPSSKASNEPLRKRSSKEEHRTENDCDPSLGRSRPSASNGGTPSLPFTCIKALFEAKYLELDLLGEGGYGSVYAGERKEDNFPVAIKHIHKEDVKFQPVVLYGKTCMVPLEVILMVKVAIGASSEEKSAAVLILDWYELEEEVILVMERPVPCVCLRTFLEQNDGPLEEGFAKNIMKQMVDAALKMHANGVFHRDIKSQNLLLETGSTDPRVRVIDFGCGCIIQEKPYSSFCGTRMFAPPEVATGERYEAAPTTVWQLGALLFEMLHREQLFSTLQFFYREFSFSSELSQDCRNFLELCLTRSPKKRATLEQLQVHPWLQDAAQTPP